MSRKFDINIQGRLIASLLQLFYIILFSLALLLTHSPVPAFAEGIFPSLALV